MAAAEASPLLSLCPALKGWGAALPWGLGTGQEDFLSQDPPPQGLPPARSSLGRQRPRPLGVASPPQPPD